MSLCPDFLCVIDVLVVLTVVLLPLAYIADRKLGHKEKPEAKG
ncbi:MAG: hypothetical protein NTY20_03515 [Candidatus Aenigmarchaeota archaeon]|nr:hypothetical protein [Candidatus Aenigmarchaeota archaeon]